MKAEKHTISKIWYKDWFNSKYYHILYKDRDHSEAISFIETLFAFLKLDNSSQVVDMACGKGRHAQKIADLGFSTIGMDLSEESIDFAQKFENERLKFIVHDMLASPKKHFSKADLICNLFTSFGYFKTYEDHLKVIRNFSSCLEDDGLFLFDFMNANKVINELNSKEVKSIDGIDFNITREVKNNIIYKTIAFEAEGESYSHTEEVYGLKLEDFKKMFETCGLTIKHKFGNYDLSSFDINNSPRLIVIAQK